MRAIRIGLTGPIGCGKSTVAAQLGGYGLVLVDADDVAREVVEPGSTGFDAVVAAFGRELVTADGSLDRAALGRVVFADPEALRRLERIVHPLVRPKILERAIDADTDGAPGVVIEAIKLVEGGLATMCDEVWLVVCDPARQLQRLAERGVDDTTARQRIDAQGDIADRLRPAATRLLDTSGSLEATRVAVEDAWKAAVYAAIERSLSPGGGAGLAH
ncbi:MAG TPA: dephospho-CoA kinase [Candidatus Limnocylindrales bacterium]|jgi:dephospho-CoA kinase